MAGTKKLGKKKNDPLTVTVRGGVLQISIGCNVLASAIATGDDFHRFDDEKDEYVRDFAITDGEKFAADVMRELEREEEDGSTLLSKLLDEAGRSAIDDGSGGVDYEQRITFGEKSGNENW
jgi:hypothetical protein